MHIIDETDHRFYAKQSTLPNAGLGCFTKVPLKAGDYLEVIGVYVRVNSPADLCTHYANRYKFAAREGYTCYIVPMGYGGLVNHTDDKALQNVELRWIKNLAKRSPHAGEIVYTAIRDIGADEELLGNYGTALAKEIKWASENAGIIDESEKEWETFLGADLYNLGLLRESF